MKRQTRRRMTPRAKRKMTLKCSLSYWLRMALRKIEHESSTWSSMPIDTNSRPAHRGFVTAHPGSRARIRIRHPRVILGVELSHENDIGQGKSP